MLKKTIYLLFLCTSLMSFAQEMSVYPTQFPNYIYGTWVNSKNEITLIITEEYMVVDNELFGYNNITKLNDELFFTCVNYYNNDIKYVNINRINTATIILDEGFKITELTKLSKNHLKHMPNSLIDVWRADNNQLKINKKEVVYQDCIYKIDYVTTADGINHHIVIYNNSEYTLLRNYKSNNTHYLNAHFFKTTAFKKASFYQKHKKEFIIGYCLVFLLIGYIIIHWSINSSRKKEINKRLFVEMQLKSIRSQMNPHFLFNALSAIQNLINKGDNEKANHYLTEFSQLMRLTLDKSEKGLVPLDDEIKSIKKYLEIEKLRFHFNYEINTETSVNIHQTEIPAMLIQPIVENAIIHGLHQKKGNKNLWITFSIKDNCFICTVTDNGVGIKATKIKESIHTNRQKYGLKLAQDRMDLINKNYHTKTAIHITDISDKDPEKTGTEVKIIMPLKY
ncbi:sensor histidine kinase [Wenyingzhuangia sp. IMCC45467]